MRTEKSVYYNADALFFFFFFFTPSLNVITGKVLVLRLLFCSMCFKCSLVSCKVEVPLSCLIVMQC